MIENKSNSTLSADGGADVSNLVTSLTITPSDPLSGDQVSVKATFDDPDDAIQPGDVIKLAWPATGQAFMTAYSQSFPLVDPTTGLLLANVVVTDGTATITFTNNVTKLHDITGHVNFKATVWNLATGDAEDKKTIQVTCGSQSVPVTITKPESGGGGDVPDYYSKSGKVWPSDQDHIVWYLNTNVNKETLLANTTIVDTIQAGQQLVPDSFTIYNSTATYFYTGPNAIAEFEGDQAFRRSCLCMAARGLSATGYTI